MVQLRSRQALDLDRYLSFHRHEWRASRALWIFLLLLMLATGLGLFGNGPLSRRRTEISPGGLAVEYDRFGRFGASMRVVAHVPVQADRSATLVISRSLLDAFLVQQITPAPAATDVASDAVTYRFDAPPAAHLPVVFEVQPRVRWNVQGFIGAGDERVRLRHFIYP